MKKTFWLGLICMFLGSAVQAQDEGVFWRISGNGLSKPSYLFGTIHLVCEEEFHLGTQVEEKLKESNVLILEVDLDDPSLALSMLSKMHNAGGEKITDFLTDDEYELTRGLLMERTGVDIGMLKSMRPFMLMSLIYPNLMECETKSYENELMRIAKSNQMEVQGLESVDDQLSVFDQIPLKDQYRSFFEYAGNLAKGKEEFKQLIEAYNKEEIGRLVQMVADSPEYRDYQDILLDNRNRNWIDPMGDLMTKGPIFFAVGAGHLGGEMGLIELLKYEGYKVTRLKND